MYCINCGAELTVNGNFCPYCGSRLENTSVSGSLLRKAVSTAQETNRYNLVLISKGTCDAVMAGDLLEDVFGYTDAESGNLVRMVPVVVAENLTSDEAATIAQMYTEYGMEVSITDENDQFVDLSSKAKKSVFDSYGELLAGAAAVIGTLTVANRISSYRRFKRPSLLDRIFHLHYTPASPDYHRNFRPRLDPKEVEPRKTIRRPAPEGNHVFGNARSTRTAANNMPVASGGGQNHRGSRGSQSDFGPHSDHGNGNIRGGSNHGSHGGRR